MCLDVDNEIEREFRQRLNESGEVTCYKCFFIEPATERDTTFVEVDGKKFALSSIYHKTTIAFGEYVSDRRDPHPSHSDFDTDSMFRTNGFPIVHIERGIHVYIHDYDASRYAKDHDRETVYYRRSMYPDAADSMMDYMYTVAVPVTCKKEDLVAAGWFGFAESAVFMKVTIKKEDVEAAVRNTIGWVKKYFEEGR